MDNKNYQISRFFVFSNANVRLEGNITYLPMYMLMFIKKETLPENMIYTLDISKLM